MEPIRQQIADRLKIIRRKRDVNQREVATAIGVERPTYSRYETGTLGLGNEMIVALANFFKVPVGYFYGDEAATALEDAREAAAQADEARKRLEKIIAVQAAAAPQTTSNEQSAAQHGVLKTPAEILLPTQKYDLELYEALRELTREEKKELLTQLKERHQKSKATIQDNPE